MKILSVIIIMWLTILCTSAATNAGSALQNMGAKEIHQSSNQSSLVEDFNNVVFEVISDYDKECFAKFWLLPSMHSDGTYTKFSVYINEQFAGNIIPQKGNWQSAGLDNNTPIRLKEGYNIIRIATPVPETPNITSMKLALTEDECNISSADYNVFIESATDSSYYIPEEYSEEESSDSNNLYTSSSEPSTAHFVNIPLLYTFYTTFSFSEGETVHISTTSSTDHDVDILYLGKRRQIAVLGDIPNDNSEADNLYVSTDLGTTRVKLTPNYTLASSEELQGLNWKGLSRYDTKSSINKIDKTIKIPKTGIYLIRLRHRESGRRGLANLNVKYNSSTYSYEGVPITFTWIGCELPANGNAYGSMSFCDNSETDDPILFIHGADADRIVGFSDDAPDRFISAHNLSKFDSHICQEYNVKTSGVSISNYSSKEPESSCEILVGFDESLVGLNKIFQFNSKRDKSHDPSISSRIFNDVDIYGSCQQNDMLSIKAPVLIKKLTICDMAGNIVASYNVNDYLATISGSTLNLEKTSIYILHIDSEDGSVSKKIFVK